MDGDDITALAPDKKARLGLFLSMQYPPEIAGVTVSSFLRTAVNARREKPLGVVEFHQLLKEKMAQLAIDPSFSGRSLNEGFSGGEKKRMEILQLALLNPKYAVLDETDSGLDVDALKVVTDGINRVRGDMGILLITHYTRILKYLVPDKVHVMMDGRIVKSGDKDLAELIEKEGYASFSRKA
jgi:Fe-S cluster assembly ATP-binding protein